MVSLPNQGHDHRQGRSSGPTRCPEGLPSHSPHCSFYQTNLAVQLMLLGSAKESTEPSLEVLVHPTQMGGMAPGCLPDRGLIKVTQQARSPCGKGMWSCDPLGPLLLNRHTDEAVPGPSVFPSREPGVSGDFWAPEGREFSGGRTEPAFTSQGGKLGNLLGRPQQR